MKTSKFIKPIFALAIVLALIAALYLPALAAATGQPVLKIVKVLPGDAITVWIDNLPANTSFTVSMKQVGNSAVGGIVAHFESGTGGSRQYSFEIHADVRSLTNVEFRIDSGTGYAATAIFNNTSSLTAPVATAAPVVPVATVAPTTTTGATSNLSSGIRMVHVQKGGWVQVELRGMPSDEEMTVTIGKAGTQSIGGSVVAHLNTGTVGTWTFLFEIPITLSKEASLDVRIEGNKALYVLTFDNAEK
jgi:hypothetical protein